MLIKIAQMSRRIVVVDGTISTGLDTKNTHAHGTTAACGRRRRRRRRTA